MKNFIRRALGRRPLESPWDNRNPVREELFSVERLEEHARSLAVAQTVTPKHVNGHTLGRRLSDNAAVLLGCHRAIARIIDDGGAITPAAEWLLDNYYLVERQIHAIRSDLPSGYYHQLPKLAVGPFRGYPRVLGAAWAFVAHTDSRFDPEMLRRYVRAYQEVQPLTIGELWALAITLRIVFIESLRRLAQSTVETCAARQEADGLADRLLGTGGRIAEAVSVVLVNHERAPLPNAMAVQLVYRLRDQDPRLTPALTWLDERLVRQGTTTDDAVRDEHQKQGAASVTVRNIITSMRLLSDVDWTELVESVSLVDEQLGADGRFGDMDFPTRNLYRSAIEELARGSKLPEVEVARAAATCASGASDQPGESGRQGDPGYYLLAGGRPAFETMIGYRPSLRAWPDQVNRSFGIGGYILAIALTTAALLAFPLLVLAGGAGLGGAWIGLLGVLGAIPAIDAAVALVNRVALWRFRATPLPALDLRDGIPSKLRTVIAVPTLLTSVAAVAEQIERLEVHYLASPEGDLLFVLLSDWADATTESAPGDGALLTAAVEGIARLNRRHGPAPGGRRFVLLHRRRIWNDGEGRWIGWERKRGKLHELNRLLRGATDTSFIGTDGEPPALPANVRYVVTLDADTRLPRDTVRRLIGKMAHPLNQPRFDSVSGRIVEGYAVIQPRVTPSLPVGREGSLFQRTFSSMGGIDPYGAAVSDVYQDLFGAGSYAGKGIYDIDAFEAALADRVPDSTLLSHDLFEGVFASAGLASDVEVVEEFPSRYEVDAWRHHRWARGDWQLLPWILGTGPGPAGRGRRNAIPAIGRWKMLDNLRRSLSAPAAILALMGGWCMLTAHNALVWTLFVSGTIILPTLIPVIGAILPHRAGVTVTNHVLVLAGDLRLALTQSALRIIWLADQAWLMGDAIGRTLVRLFVTRRHLLEWVTAAQTTAGPGLDIRGYYRRMAGAPLIGILAVGAAALSSYGTWSLAAVCAALWIASPAVARWVSLSPLIAGHLPMPDGVAHSLRLTARRTWRFFETFVTPADHMLPPDNFQEDPTPTLAHRTSPTNIGLYLLSTATACDFGWAGITDTVERLEATFATLQSLARFRGHFYNWYDTKNLQPLAPIYISTVDSGNLAGHLIALAHTLRDWRFHPRTAIDPLRGLKDALDLARDEARHLDDGRRTQTVTWQQLDQSLTTLTTSLALPPISGLSPLARLSDLSRQAEKVDDIAVALANERNDDIAVDLQFWTAAMRNSIESQKRDLSKSNEAAATLDARLESLERRARDMALAMEFGFLLDSGRRLLSIGYLPDEGTRDSNCYDLLASEARLASFLAIAKGDVPARHWFRLGRAVTGVARGSALISWSGSMFEYLMPSLVMRAPAGSLIEQTSRLITRRQIDHGMAIGVPWGISESAYNARDLELTYQYSNFGVPGLGLKRGLGDSTVIAPYATALAAMVDPCAAVRNLERLTAIGGRGRYGFYEALDYTPARLPEGATVAVVRAFMAHHQGMTIVAIANALLDGVMRTRFHAEPIVQAAELLLQERAPRDVAEAHPLAAETTSKTRTQIIAPPGGRRLTTAHGASPATHLLSNGQYTVMLTAAGSGYSRWRDLAVTRWREDVTCDDRGSYLFLRDVVSGTVWSAGFQPTGVEPGSYEVGFNEDRAEITRRDGSLTTTLDVVVSAEFAGEVRRVSISNAGNRSREIDVTSYTELVLAPQAADIAHTAFSKLFVETEHLSDLGVLLATRRRRDPNEDGIWAAHLSVVDGIAVGGPEVETDRARFLGRGGTPRSPISVIDGRPLSNTVGTVLDPVFALRRRVRIPPGEIVRISFWTMVAPTRDAVLDLADKQRDATAFDRAAMLAWTQAQVQLHHLGIDRGEADLYQRLAGHLLYASSTLRPASETILRGGGNQAGLWALGVSGDLPIILLRISDTEDLEIACHLRQAQDYWRMKQFAVDVIILNERASSYVQDLQNTLETLFRSGKTRRHGRTDGHAGGTFILRADLIPAETHALLLSVARVVLVAQRGRLSDQLDRTLDAVAVPRQPVSRWWPAPSPPQAAPALPDLEFFNGLGGFANGGRDYVIVLGPGQSTPAPWINVIANPRFGFQVSAEGSGYSWSLNSRENQLTSWSNDPVTDPPAEAFYLRDDDTGDLWSPTVQPIRDATATYLVRHGFGYSLFSHASHGIAADLLQFVPLEDPLKISRLTLRNLSGRPRHLSLTAFVEWVLGPSRMAAAPFVTTEIDPGTGAMFARNPWTIDFGSRVAFADLGGRQTDWTGDRREFIGRNGTLANPMALGGPGALSRKVGAGLDPCGALRTTITMPVNGRIDIVFFLGEASGAEEARALIGKYRDTDPGAVRAEVDRHWDRVLSQVTVTTPDRAMDIMLNGWLLYQTLACRMWARSAFYQASGAYGFRDQLQDGMALAASCPAITRDHLLRAAARQFGEGDVQHWWLPQSGVGVRTRISDDRIWLAYAVAHFVDVTGDRDILEEPVSFLEGQRLSEGDHDSFFRPAVSDESGSLFEHCARALDRSLTFGDHGLPLIGTGDWNDGMNRVGALGRGESVWLGWFLHRTLTAFASLAETRQQTHYAENWRTVAATLRTSLEREAWDGDWYRRGFFDDGTPLGSASNEECRIDSIAQSWAVLSGIADPARAARAMAAVERELIRPTEKLALLFAPPFDRTTPDPGYIKGYPPGIRENGGQYTHAAMWSVMALAQQGEGDRALRLFSLLNPINHTRSRAEVVRYKVEPYVVAADVYARPPHVGRGGWTWYTGSAGWMQRAGIEAILGLTLRGDVLHLAPCIPPGWPGFAITLRHRSALYDIRLDNPDHVAGGVAALQLDGKAIIAMPDGLTLLDDGRTHHLVVTMGKRTSL